MSEGGRVRIITAGAAAMALAGLVMMKTAPGAGAAVRAVSQPAQGSPTPPTVSLSEPSVLTDNTASLTVTVNSFGRCGNAGVRSVDQTTGNSGDIGGGSPAFQAITGNQTVPLSVTGLTPSSTYTLTIFAITDNCADGSQVLTTFGNSITITALPGPAPTDVITGSADPVFDTEAEVHGTFVALGSPTPTFQYGTTTSYGSVGTTTLGTDAASDGSQPIQARALIFDLLPGTLYHYRLVVDDGHNPTVYGPDETFTTTPSTQLPVGAVGGAGFAGLMALVLAWQMHRSRRRSGLTRRP